MFDPTEKVVVFTPAGVAATFTDPSYHLPAFYDVWGCFDTTNQPFWKTVAANSRAFFQKVTHPTTGLAPEYANFDGSPSSLPTKGDFRVDSWRVVSNVMMDYHFWGVDPWQSTYATRLGEFFASRDYYGCEYRLDGTELTSGHDVGLIAMNATLGFALPPADARRFVQDLWDATPPTGTYRYYAGMLYLLGLLHVSGNFHLWY